MSHPRDIHVANQTNEMRKQMEEKQNLDIQKHAEVHSKGQSLKRGHRRSSSKFKTSREAGVPKAENVPDRRSSYKLKTSRETWVPKAEVSRTEEARPSSRRLGKQEYLRRKRPGHLKRQVWIDMQLEEKVWMNFSMHNTVLTNQEQCRILINKA